MVRNNISTTLFGRSGWKWIHQMALSADLETFTNFIYCMRSVLPCVSCREHFSELIESVRFPEDDRDSIRKFAYFLHDSVNRRIGKRSISLEEYMKITDFGVNWLFIHALTFGYDPEIKKETIEFFRSIEPIKVILPGAKDSDFDSTDSLVKTVFNAHNGESNWKYNWNVFLQYYKDYTV